MVVLSPLLVGVMRQVRARMEGRAGAGVLQPWRDLRKLLAKEPLQADGTTWVLVRRSRGAGGVQRSGLRAGPAGRDGSVPSGPGRPVRGGLRPAARAPWRWRWSVWTPARRSAGWAPAGT